MATQEFVVSGEEAGERVDVFLRRHVPDMSRAKAKALAAEGAVRIDGRRSRKGTLLQVGQTVSLDSAPPPKEFKAAPNAELPLNVVQEHADWVIVDKPAGMAMHPLRPEETNTLCNALVARYPEMAEVGYATREPGILHRLDNETSGLVLAARSAEAFAALRETLTSNGIDKRYTALVAGEVIAPKTIDTPLAHEPGDKRKIKACFDEREVERLGARPALTEVLSSESRGEHSLVEVLASSARRHQVRVHLAAFGHPLVGDVLYGGPEGSPRHLLHASMLGFSYGGEKFEIRSTLPTDFQL